MKLWMEVIDDSLKYFYRGSKAKVTNVSKKIQVFGQA